MPVTPDEVVVEDQTNTQSMKRTMQTRRVGAEEPQAKRKRKKKNCFRGVRVEAHRLPCAKNNSSNGSRCERSFTAGVMVCYRGDKSAASHGVSSVRQLSSTPGWKTEAAWRTSGRNEIHRDHEWTSDKSLQDVSRADNQSRLSDSTLAHRRTH